MSFAGLHELLRPLLARVDELPSRQRDALRIAVGLSDVDDSPDFFLIALAALGLLGERASENPILIIAEDAHWLDPSTCDVLAFVARRLETDSIILLISSRGEHEGPLDQVGLPEIVLARLDEAAAAELLDAQGRELAPGLREHLLAQAAGNPLALVELPAAVEQLADATLPPPWLPLTTRLEQAFAARVVGLGHEMRLVA